VPRATKSNVPAAALRWSVVRAGVEFGLTSNTLRKALNKNSAQAGENGLYTTRQICDAVFGGLNEEKLATQRQLTRKYELENANRFRTVRARAHSITSKRQFSSLSEARAS
jgi:hypothetical protein